MLKKFKNFEIVCVFFRKMCITKQEIDQSRSTTVKVKLIWKCVVFEWKVKYKWIFIFPCVKLYKVWNIYILSYVSNYNIYSFYIFPCQIVFIFTQKKEVMPWNFQDYLSLLCVRPMTKYNCYLCGCKGMNPYSSEIRAIDHVVNTWSCACARTFTTNKTTSTVKTIQQL